MDNQELVSYVDENGIPHVFKTSESGILIPHVAPNSVNGKSPTGLNRAQRREMKRKLSGSVSRKHKSHYKGGKP